MLIAMSGIWRFNIWKGFGVYAPRRWNRQIVSDRLVQSITRYPLCRRIKHKDIGKRGRCPLRKVFRQACEFVGIFGISSDEKKYTRPIFSAYRRAISITLRRKVQQHRRRIRNRQAVDRGFPEAECQSMSSWLTDRLLKRQRKCTRNHYWCRSHRCGNDDGPAVHTGCAVRTVRYWVKEWRKKLWYLGYRDTKAKRHVRKVMDACEIYPTGWNPREIPNEQVVLPEGGCAESVVVYSNNCGSIQTNGIHLLDGSKQQPDVYILQETRVREWKLGRQVHWRFVNFPRTHNNGGGTGFLVRPGLMMVKLGDRWYRDGTGGFEVCWIKIKVVNGWIYLASVYVPPGKNPANGLQVLRDHIQEIRGGGDCCGILLGCDLNTSLYSSAILRNAGLDGQRNTSFGRRWREWIALSPWRNETRVLNDPAGYNAGEEEYEGDEGDEGNEGDVREEGGLSYTHLHVDANRGTRKTVIDYMIWIGPRNGAFDFQVHDSMSDHRFLTTRLDSHLVLPPPPEQRPKIRLLAMDPRKGEYQAQFKQRFEEVYGNGEIVSYEDFSTSALQVMTEVVGTYVPTSRLSFGQTRWWCRRLSKLCRRYKRLRRRRTRQLLRGIDDVRTKSQCIQTKHAITRLLHRRRQKYWINHRREWSMETESVVSRFNLLRSLNRRSTQIHYTHEELEQTWQPIFGSPPPADSGEAEAREYVDNYDWQQQPSLDAVVSAEQVQAAIKEIHRRKATGNDGIPNELLKALPDVAILHLATLFTQFLQDPTTIPEHWFDSLLCMVPKVANPATDEFRPISLLSCVAKLLERIVWMRVRSLNFFHRDMGAFMLLKGCPEQTWRMRIVSEWLKKKGKCGYVLFMDLSKAYDTVPTYTLIKKMLDNPDIPEYVTRFSLHWLTGHSKRILLNGRPGSEMPSARGTPQGSVLSPWYYNIFHQDLFEMIEQGCPESVFGAEIPAMESISCRYSQEGQNIPLPPDADEEAAQDHDIHALLEEGLEGLFAINGDVAGYQDAVDAIDMDGEGDEENEEDQFAQFLYRALGYADDLAGMATKPEQLQRLLEICDRWALINGMRWNPTKCKVMRMGRIPRGGNYEIAHQFSLYGQQLEQVDLYTYLGVVQKAQSQHKYLDLTKAFKEIEEKFLDPPYAMVQARYGCNLAVGYHIIQAQVLPKLLNGATTFPPPEEAERVWVRTIKKVLCCYRTDSNAKVKEFVGSRDLSELVRSRMIRFILKLASSERYPELRELLLCVMADTNIGWTSTSWVAWAWKELESAVEDRELLSLPYDGQVGDTIQQKLLYLFNSPAACRKALEDFNKTYRRRRPLCHPAMRHCPEKAHFTFRFFTGRFNPVDLYPAGNTPPCYFCGVDGGDKPAHFKHCTSIEVLRILRQGLIRLGWQEELGWLPTLRHVISKPDMYSGILYKDPEKWKVFCWVHMCLWRARKKKLDGNGVVAAVEDEGDEGDAAARADEGDDVGVLEDAVDPEKLMGVAGQSWVHQPFFKDTASRIARIWANLDREEDQASSSSSSSSIVRNVVSNPSFLEDDSSVSSEDYDDVPWSDYDGEVGVDLGLDR